jgi:hypothetical protein
MKFDALLKLNSLILHLLFAFAPWLSLFVIGSRGEQALIADEMLTNCLTNKIPSKWLIDRKHSSSSPQDGTEQNDTIMGFLTTYPILPILSNSLLTWISKKSSRRVWNHYLHFEIIILSSRMERSRDSVSVFQLNSTFIRPPTKLNYFDRQKITSTTTSHS